MFFSLMIENIILFEGKSRHKSFKLAFDEIYQLLYHLLHFAGIRCEVHSCVENQDLLGIEPLKPLFMLFMYQLQVLRRNICFFGPFALIYPFRTFRWLTSEIYYFCSIYRNKVFERFIHSLENFIFTLIHELHIFHNFRENMLICQYTSFRNFDFLWISFTGLLEFFYSCEQREHLKCKAPTLWLIVISLEHISF